MFQNRNPKANSAQGEAYEGAHGGGDGDWLEGGMAHMAIGDDGPPPWYGSNRGPPSNQYEYGEALNVAKYTNVSRKWILDGGATHHFSPSKEFLFDYVPDINPVKVKVAVDQFELRAGVGSMRVHTMVDGVPFFCVITNVWHMPSFANSLLSANQLKAKDNWVISGREGDMSDYIFDSDNKLWLKCGFINGLCTPIWSLEICTKGKAPSLYRKPQNVSIPLQSIPNPAIFQAMIDERTNASVQPPEPNYHAAYFARSNTPMDKETADLWHQRLGHVSMNSLQQLVRRQAIAGITIPVQEFHMSASHPCEVCIMAKHNRAPHLKELPKPVNPLDVASSDLAGPYNLLTMNLVAYILTFVDWCTQHCTVALLQKKSDAFAALKRIIMMHKNIKGTRLKTLFSDRGGEYTSDSLKEWFHEKGITHDFLVKADKESNGVAERMNQTLNNMVRSMMLQYGTHKPLWGEAMMYAVRIKNCSLNKKLGMTPHEAFTGKVPDVSNFCTFGCLVYARVPEEDRKKLDPKSVPGIYLGPELNGPGYRVLIYKKDYKRPLKYTVHVFRDIVTFENMRAVTGKQSHTDMHWGGGIPLPQVETGGPPEVPALGLEPDAENMQSHHGTGIMDVVPSLYERLKAPGTFGSMGAGPSGSGDIEMSKGENVPQEHTVPRLETPVVQKPLLLENGSDTCMVDAEGMVDAREQSMVDAQNESMMDALKNKGKRSRESDQLGPIYPGKRNAGHRPTLPVQSVSTKKVAEKVSTQQGVQPPSEGGYARNPSGPHPSPPPTSSGIQRVGAANVTEGMGEREDFLTLLMDIEYDPVVAAAYTAHAPFDPPPSETIMSKEELVDGLLTSFEVPLFDGPLPVMTEIDPKHPPKTLKQAMSTKYARFWAVAVVDEWLSIMQNNTWELVDKEPWMKIIPCKWVFVVKVDEKGIPTKFKARLVAGGHRQVEGIDYDETYAHVSRMTTLRILLDVAASQQWIVNQLDIKTAFLHGKADLDIYMRQPSGFHDGNNLQVCRLKRTLYGLKQAPRAWYFVLKGVLNELGFEQMSADSSFWVHKTKTIVVFLTTIVDDMLVTSHDVSYTNAIIDAILAKLPGTKSGRATYYNGLRITWLDDTREVLITQAAHVEKLYEKFCEHMATSKKRALPAKEGFRVCKTGSSSNPTSKPMLECEKLKGCNYRELIGGISYITHVSRPDAIHTLNQLAKWANYPMVEHWDRAIDLLNFLYNSRYWGLKLGGKHAMLSQVTYITRPYTTFGKEPEPLAVGYADANHGTSIDDKRSISGFVIKVLGGPVSWASRTQNLTAGSTTESKFWALSECSREALWVAKLLAAFNIPCTPFVIRGDSQGALSAITNSQYTKHTKHIEIVHDFMKDRFMSGQLRYEYVRGEDNPADIFTKCLGGPKFGDCRIGLGMAELPPHLRN